VPVEYHWFSPAFPHGGLAAMPKLLLLDAGLYAYLVVRQLDGIGFDFRLRLRDVGAGMREWLFFAPVAIGLGLALHFIVFHRWLPPGGRAAAAWLVTFFFVAVPEELFFRGLLQNLLETRLGRTVALLMASPIFGLSHYNKGNPPFNWRYVLLATIAGIFYGRAWRDRRRIFASGITHASVDVVWGLWFR
jgi:membrane protease YdiL (CAAX protease family)